MKWEKVRLKDICLKVISGGTPKSTELRFYMPKEVPWLKTGEVNFCRIYSTENYISLEGLKNSSARIIPENSVIIAMYGQGDTAGRVAINKVPLCTNQACCNLIINSDVANYEYIYYVLRTLYKKLVSLKNGGAQPNLNSEIIKSLEIDLPDLSTQHKIVSILANYDDLIENNQKQIKLLEEAAQRLYKEWFVDLRFPGYEQTKIIDGVPEGWKISTLDKVANLKAGGDKPKVYSDIVNSVCKIPIYSNGSENEGLYGYTDKARILEECITISARGNVGYTCLRRTPFVPIVRLISVIPIDIDVIYLYYYLKNLSFDSNGAAQQQITIPMIKEYKVIVPSEEILLEYRKVACSIHDKIDIIKNQNNLLKEARDRLLPKLMSGEIEV